MPNRRHLLSFVQATALSAAFTALACGEEVDFARDVLPIFQRACFECHDAKLQKGKFHLDSRALALQKPGLIVPGQAARSELVRRITLPKGHDDVMPSRGEPLSKSQVALIKAWIDQGAQWPENAQTGKHWAYVKPVRPAVPPVQGSKFKVQSPVDAFVFARRASPPVALRCPKLR